MASHPSTRDCGTQAGEFWAPYCAKQRLEPCNPDSLTDSQRTDEILHSIGKRAGWKLGSFILHLVARGKNRHSNSTTQSVSSFLKGSSTTSPREIVEEMYEHPSSRPKPVRGLNTAAGQARLEKRGTGESMARRQLEEWAILTVERAISTEAEKMSSKDGGFHLPLKNLDWTKITAFSLSSVIEKLESDSPVTVRILKALALAKEDRIESLVDRMKESPPEGRGGNRRNPAVIIAVAAMLLFGARNPQFSLFRRVIGVWLFANSASDNVFSILSRMGLSMSYTNILKSLRSLSHSIQQSLQSKAKSRAFLLLYDNINRMRRAWDTDLGGRDAVLSGTAATYIELDDCDVLKALDPAPLVAATAEKKRAQLNIETLYSRIKIDKLDGAFALHTLNLLVQQIDLPKFREHSRLIADKFRSESVAIHRMRDGRTTTVHPMATSNHNEGTTEGNRDVIDDLLLRQLGKEKNEVDRLLTIVSGDQSTIEKVRTLKRFLGDCPHGYSRYGWIIPLIQLWHMGWADLERILATHWGQKGATLTQGDISTFSFINSILKRNIKNTKRPDYYPTQAFIFDNLKAEILDCWKLQLDQTDLEQYFTNNSEACDFDTLFKHAQQIAKKYMSISSHGRVMSGSPPEGIPCGTPWRSNSDDPPPPPPSDEAISGDSDDHSNSDEESDAVSSEADSDDRESDDMSTLPDSAPKVFRGDETLANSILRMRDSMLHYEFQYAVSDGDIGRAMNVMAVWAFTFAGAGKSKYANELLELTCHFEYEYSDELQKAILNNWLCNISGLPGCWFPLDLLQEHNIRQLKQMSQRRNADFGGAFFQEIIAYNVRAFLDVNSSLKRGVNLSQKSGSHRAKKKVAGMKALSLAMVERELHKFRAGRQTTHRANNDFELGYLAYDNPKKLNDFIKRTLEHIVDPNMEETSEDQEEIIGEQLSDENSASRISQNMVINGVLTSGDDQEDSEEEEDEEDDLMEL